jgi:hypothetical protein
MWKRNLWRLLLLCFYMVCLYGIFREHNFSPTDTIIILCAFIAVPGTVMKVANRYEC